MGEQNHALVGTDSENEPNTTVVCFDRDWTVSVNPRRGKAAVPLAWVKQLAHGNPEVDVWATGNQLLTQEASIHGTSYAAALWDTLFDADVEGVYSGERDYYYKPSRSNRLRIIYDIYEEVTPPETDLTLVVVDDVDLTKLEFEGWSYYKPWDFVTKAFANVFDFLDIEEATNFHSVSDTELGVGAGREPEVSLGEPSKLKAAKFDASRSYIEPISEKTSSRSLEHDVENISDILDNRDTFPENHPMSGRTNSKNPDETMNQNT